MRIGRDAFPALGASTGDVDIENGTVIDNLIG
jgi:hypothetical protein